jgi:hypothetical protein
MKHILERIHSPRDPDSRAEAVSYCGQWDECSGSGKHGMVGHEQADCQACIKAYLSEFDYFWETSDEDHLS